MYMRLKQAGRVARRLPFTLLTLAALIILGVATHTVLQPISSSLLLRLGFASSDVWTFHWDRMVTSALVTSGAHGFWLALFGVGICAGAAEWLAGSWRAALGFWGVHVITLLASSAVALALFHGGIPGVNGLVFDPDVGPSAGTFGCLGLAAARLPKPWRNVGSGVIFGVLLVVMLLPLAGLKEDTASIGSNIAHVIAFPLGWLASSLLRRQTHASGRPSESASGQRSEAGRPDR